MQTQQISSSKSLSTVWGWAWEGQAGSCGPVNWVLSPNLFKVSQQLGTSGPGFHLST